MVIRGYDIAWPINRTIEVPPASLVIVADACRRATLFLRARTAGTGPAVTSIIMAITVRPMALDHLSGDGLDTLRSRL